MFLLDGIDKLPDLQSDNMMDFHDLLVGKTWPFASIIITTSSWSVDFDLMSNDHVIDTCSESSKSNFLYLLEVCDNWRKFALAGLSRKQILEHSCNFFKSSKLAAVPPTDLCLSDYEAFLDIFHPDLLTLSRPSPTLSYLLAFVWLQCKIYDKMQSLTISDIIVKAQQHNKSIDHTHTIKHIINIYL